MKKATGLAVCIFVILLAIMIWAFHHAMTGKEDSTTSSAHNVRDRPGRPVLPSSTGRASWIHSIKVTKTGVSEVAKTVTYSKDGVPQRWKHVWYSPIGCAIDVIYDGSRVSHLDKAGKVNLLDQALPKQSCTSMAFQIPESETDYDEIVIEITYIPIED